MTREEAIARSAASTWSYCHKCDGVINETKIRCDKQKMHTCWKWYDGYRTALIALGKAEKDLALTWQDIREIIAEAHRMATIPESKRAYTEEEYYTEILRRFKKKCSGEKEQ